MYFPDIYTPLRSIHAAVLPAIEDLPTYHAASAGHPDTQPVHPESSADHVRSSSCIKQGISLALRKRDILAPNYKSIIRADLQYFDLL